MAAQVRGVETVLKAFGKARRATGQRIEDGLKQCAEILLTASLPLVPVATGFLKGTGRTEVRGKGLSAEALALYETRYAIYVHEMVGVYHTPPTQARYLSDAVPKVRGTMAALLKRQLKANTQARL